MRRSLVVLAVLAGASALAHAAEVSAPAAPAADVPVAAVPAAPVAPPDVKPPGPRALPEIPKGGRVLLLTVDGTIDLGIAPFLERQLDGLTAKDVVVLDINTFGGRVDAAVRIRDALLHTPARSVCWVNPRAISAGALISLACDVIVVADGASIGAATPIQIGDGGEAKPVEEKMVSYMRSEMRATAEAKGRSSLIGEAMVDARIVVPGLDDDQKLLTLDGDQALAWGVAELRAADQAQLWDALGVDPSIVERPHISWAERVARFLSDPTISGLLMSLGMLGILIELYSPGHGLSLAAGLICLGLFFFGHHVVNLAGWEEILLFVVGIGLLVFEVAVPGHILPGVFGAILIVASLALALVNFDAVPLTVAWRAGWIQQALAHVFGSILITAALTWGLAKLLPHTRVGRPLVLQASLAGMRTGAAIATVAAGARGQAVTDLRPSGTARFGAAKLEVVLETGFVRAGEALEVVAVEGGRVTVKPVTA